MYSLHETKRKDTKCDFQFVFQKKLSEHIKVEHEGFEYKCESCDYTSTSSVTLKSHTDVKHGRKMVACESHDFTCKQNDKLQRHVLVNHNGHESLVYKCNLCESAFKRKEKLKHKQKKYSNNDDGEAIIAIGIKQIVVNQPPSLECGKSHSFVETYQVTGVITVDEWLRFYMEHNVAKTSILVAHPILDHGN